MHVKGIQKSCPIYAHSFSPASEAAFPVTDNQQILIWLPCLSGFRFTSFT